MPELDVNGTTLWYEDSGAVDGGGATIVLSHGLLFDLRSFDAQAAALAPGRRVVRYDHRGQGRSAPHPKRTISIETNYADAVALIEALDLGPVCIAGLSMGGFVAMRVAARRPDLVSSCILLDTSADPEPHRLKYRLLNLVAGTLGVRAVVGRIMPILFGKTFLGDSERADERQLWRERLAALPRSITKAVRGVIDRKGVADEVTRITAPTLIVVGEEDVATRPVRSRRLASLICSAELVQLPRTGHMSSIESPDTVSAAITSFLERVER